MALAGCAAVLVLVGLGVLALMLKAGDLVRWSLGQVRSEIVRALPDNLPAAQRQRLAAAFAAVDERLESGELDALAFQDLQRQLMRFARMGRAPTEEEVVALAAALERFAGIEPPPPGASPPGASPPGASPPGASPSGASPPGAAPSGAAPTEAPASESPASEAPSDEPPRSEELPPADPPSDRTLDRALGR
jgi:hypothetical protein